MLELEYFWLTDTFDDNPAQRMSNKYDRTMLLLHKISLGLLELHSHAYPWCCTMIVQIIQKSFSECEGSAVGRFAERFDESSGIVSERHHTSL